MRKNHWKAVAVAAVLMMTVPALLALAADKTEKAKPAGKTTEQMMPGCAMHGGADKDMDASMPGCGMKGGMSKGACCKSGGMKNCCKSGDMKGCSMKGGKGVAVCVMSGGEMKGCGMTGGKGMAGCSSHGGDMKGCGGTRGGMGKGMPGCGMKGGMGKGMEGCGPGMGAGHGPMMLKGLDLTPEQQKKVAVIHEKQARHMVQAQADIRLAEMDMQQLMRAETPDRAKIDAQIDRLAQLRAGMQKSRAATLLEVRALLTPDQLKKCQAGPMGDEDEDD
jgi:Spy/CpxP family protein refolding chaperone